MAGLQPVRGTKDLLPDALRRHHHVEETARDVALLYGFLEMETPIFEFTEVFTRTLGETSDVVTKEMYSFETSGGDKLTLRPEGTAGVARAFMSNGLNHDLPLKYFYRGPMFRHEAPQKGRQRQFHQIGVELLGVEGPLADLDVIAVGHQILAGLGLADRVTLEINTLGDAESRQAYRQVLLDYLEGHRDALSPESRDRLTRNPMRILDSKQEQDREIVANAPRMTEYLNDHSKAFFDQVLDGLTRIGIPFTRNPYMVRGLDYYCHTAFEFTTEHLGAQGTVMAGGRYDGLVGMMGGPATPGVGWAAGIERMAMMVADEAIPPAPRLVVVIPIGAAAQATAMEQTFKLRQAGHAVDLGYSGNLTKRLKRANKTGARAAVLMGEDELARGAVTLRDLDSGEQTEVALEGLAEALDRFK